MNIIGNFLLSGPLTKHVLGRLDHFPNTAIQVRGSSSANSSLQRVVIKTDLNGWQQFGQIITEYGIA